MADFNARHGAQAPGVAVERRAWYNPNLESRWTLMPGLIAALSMLQTLLLACVGREREQGTFDQLLVTPLTPMQILIGKALPAILVGLIQSTIIFLIIRFWFQIPMNGSVAAVLRAAQFNIAVVGGLSISALEQHAAGHALHLPGDHAADAAVRPAHARAQHARGVAARHLRQSAALRHEHRARRHLEGAGWREIGVDFIPLLLAAVTLPLAAWLFRNRMS